MSYYPDLGTQTMVDEGDHIRAIGWLSKDHEYKKGKTSREEVKILMAYCGLMEDSASQLLWGFYAGFHTCEFCDNFHASGNIGIPAGDILYVAPQMIVHYIEEHSYRPPTEFLTALSSAPLPGTEEYNVSTTQFREINRKRFEAMERNLP